MLTLFIFDIVYINKKTLSSERVIKVSKKLWETMCHIDLISEKLGSRVLDFQYKILN
jgi:hypothetical protein